MNDEPLKVDGIFEREERKRDIEKLEWRGKDAQTTLMVNANNASKLMRTRNEINGLVNRLKQAGEPPGDVVLRALKFMDAQSDPMRRRPTGY